MNPAAIYLMTCGASQLEPLSTDPLFFDPFPPFLFVLICLVALGVILWIASSVHKVVSQHSESEVKQ